MDFLPRLGKHQEAQIQGLGQCGIINRHAGHGAIDLLLAIFRIKLPERRERFVVKTPDHKKTLSSERACVTPEGLEPPTDRTGICYSIQLNYGAIWWGKVKQI